MLNPTGTKLKLSVHPRRRRLKPLIFFPVTWSKINASSSTALLRFRPITESSRTNALKRLSQVRESKYEITREASFVTNRLQL